jgi:CO dehydrogenase maturation factor
MHVGTYEPEDIGAGCHHGHLAILENLLSHLDPEAGDWVVCDMVAGTDDRLILVGNKVADGVDVDYLSRELGAEPLAVLPMQAGLCRARQAGAWPRPDDLDDVSALRLIAEQAHPMPPRRRTALLHALHLQLAGQPGVQRAYGDITGQFEPIAG